jgi:hypothetical protein
MLPGVAGVIGVNGLIFSRGKFIDPDDDTFVNTAKFEFVSIRR